MTRLISPETFFLAATIVLLVLGALCLHLYVRMGNDIQFMERQIREWEKRGMCQGVEVRAL